MCERERERVRERVCVCERVSVCVCVCVRERERECVCERVSVCVRERRERERVLSRCTILPSSGHGQKYIVFFFFTLNQLGLNSLWNTISNTSELPSAKRLSGDH